MNIKIISAGAGSGKTYRLTSEMVAFLSPKSPYKIRPSGIIATTFTNKAAAELQERVRVRLLSQGMPKAADELSNALIGTVHGLGVKLLKRFAFEAGVSPEVDILADEDQQVFFNQALASTLTPEMIAAMDTLSNRLGMSGDYDWRKEVKNLTDLARNNAFDDEILAWSKQKSIESLLAFFPQKNSKSPEKLNDTLKSLLETTILELRNNEDTTQTTFKVVNTLQAYLNELNTRGYLNWHDWIKISKVKPAKKSMKDVETLADFATKVETHPQLHEDIERFISNIFGLAMAAIDEYEDYKKRRGLIDYIDMEIHVNRLLDNPVVQEVMAEELDLLMVDEFQDTSPIQLEIFLKLSKFAQISVWVGDPKQSIYGFRGAEPALMQAIITKLGGVKEEDIQIYSWRSRQDVVHATNAIFVKAFSEMPPEQVALIPKREKSKDHIEQDLALMHWHFEYEGKGKRTSKAWFENCIARNIGEVLERGVVVCPKDEDQARPIRPGDIAILCRSNFECQSMAEALHHNGLKAAIARNGLMQTAEIVLVLACLKYILNDKDSLSTAEILLLATEKDIETIIEHRIEFLETKEHPAKWAKEIGIIKTLKTLRLNVSELSSTEILNVVLETLEIRRIVATWGSQEQRLSNIDQLCKLALDYEERCNRLHTAASLGGFLLWTAELEASTSDSQGSGESPDAVNILTYHKSKGLEWPMVICQSLERSLKDDVWGFKLESEEQEVDLDNLLGNRWIRYWVNPYAKQIQNTAFENRVNSSPAKSQSRMESLQEEARLLYVGITRARDYLVVPSRNEPTRWLNRCWHGDENTPALDPLHHETNWEWKGEVLQKETLVRTFPKIFEQVPIGSSEIEYFEERVGENPNFHELFIDVYKIKKEKGSKESNENRQLVDQLSKSLKPEKGNILYYQRLTTAEESNDVNNFKIIKHFLAADDLNYSKEVRHSIANSLIERLDDTFENIKASPLVNISTNFYETLGKHFSIKNIHKNFPVKITYQNRLFKENIDYIIETQRGEWILIDSRDVLRKWEERKKLKSDASWFHLSELATKAAFGLSPAVSFRYFIHFVLESQLIEVVVKEQVQLSLGI